MQTFFEKELKEKINYAIIKDVSEYIILFYLICIDSGMENCNAAK